MSQPRPRAPHANRTRTAHAIIERSREGETPTPPTRPTARPGEEARLTSRIRYIPSKYGPPPKARWKDTPRYWTNGRHHVRGAHPHSWTHHTPPTRGSRRVSCLGGLVRDGRQQSTREGPSDAPSPSAGFSDERLDHTRCRSGRARRHGHRRTLLGEHAPTQASPGVPGCLFARKSPGSAGSVKVTVTLPAPCPETCGP